MSAREAHTEKTREMDRTISHFYFGLGQTSPCYFCCFIRGVVQSLSSNRFFYHTDLVQVSGYLSGKNFSIPLFT